MKQKMTEKDLRFLTKEQKTTLQKLWTPKEGDFIFNSSANNGEGHVFTNYMHQPHIGSANWVLLITEAEKRGFLYPLLNIFDMLSLLVLHNGKDSISHLTLSNLPHLFDEVYDLFIDFLDTHADKDLI